MSCQGNTKYSGKTASMIKSGQGEIKATMRAGQETMKAVINSIRSQVEGIIINWVEGGPGI
jgi:hypothetical protein